MAEMSEIRDRLLRGLKHMRLAAEFAKETAEAGGGKVKIGILATRADGARKIICTFDAPEFFEDIAAVLGVPPITADDKTECAIEMLVDECQSAGTGEIRCDQFGPRD